VTPIAIEIRGLRKAFKGHTALNGLDLAVPAGSIFGFLGRNGAGKTTTIKSLLGMIRPDAGEAHVLGLSTSSPANALEIRRRIGYVAEEKDLYPYMTVEQIIRFTRPFFPAWSVEREQRYLRVFDLPAHRRISDLSKGMRSKLLLLLALARGAELLILDEPTDGLDPVAIEEVLRELVTIAAQGTTIFFSSHQLHEVEQIAENVAIVDAGRVVVSGSLDDLKIRYQRLNVVLESAAELPAFCTEGAAHVRYEGRAVSILADGNADMLIERIRALPGTSLERYPVGLKELFLEQVRNN
jgi:ABC-2 type transport system ATP-binding protein